MRGSTIGIDEQQRKVFQLIKTLLRSACAKFGFSLVRENVVGNLPGTIARFCPSDKPMVFDVGAHYGESVIEYRKLYPASEIHSFEPDGKTFAILQAAVQGLDRVTCIQKALSDSEGKATFFVNESSATNSLLPLSGNAKELWGDAVRSHNEQKEATLTTLDNYCKESQISHVHILKIDVQGAELRVLQGARHMLEKAAIDVIVCEVIVSQTYQGQNAFWQYLQFAEQNGLALVDLLHPVRKRNQLLQLDAVFVRNGLLNR